MSKKPRVLVVEDQEFIRKTLCKILEQNNFECQLAENGLVAKGIFERQGGELDLFVSDIRMPELDGISLLKFVRRTSKIPFVFMTGFSEIFDAKNALALGADEFISKPFRPNDLLEAIGKCLKLNPSSSTPEVALPQYCPIRIDEFLSGTDLLSDIYVKLSPTKYIRVAYKGEEVPIDRLRVYQSKKVEYLYVTLSDFSNYVNFSIKVANVAVNSDALSTKKKAQVLKHTTEVLVESCFLGDLKADFVEPAKQTVEQTLNLIVQDPDLLDIFSDLSSRADRLFAQGVAVSIYSCILAIMNDWKSTTTQFKVVLAGLLHDIGSREIDASILRKKRISRTAEETKLLESHTSRGRDLILSLGNLPPDIGTIVYQHHETPKGTGYPMALTSEAIHPIAKLIGTVDRFVHLILPIEEGMEDLDKESAILKLKNNFSEDCDSNFLEKLVELVGLPGSSQKGIA